MRYLNSFLCVLFLLFAVVQFDDPDGILWIVIYGSTAIWAWLASDHPARFAHSQPLLAGFGVTLAAMVVGMIYLWPPSIADWWENDVVREGMGLILCTLALLVIAYTLWRTRRTPRLAGAGD